MFLSLILEFQRILTWGCRPVIQSFYSLTFLKAVALIFTKVAVIDRQRSQLNIYTNPGVDLHLLSQHGHEKSDVLRCPHSRRDDADTPKYPQRLLAWPLR